MSCGWLRTTITPSRAPKLPLAREKRWPRTTSGRVPPTHQLAADARRRARSACRGCRRCRRSGSSARSPARPLRSTGSRTTPTPTSFAPVGASASSTAAVSSLGRPPRATIAIRLPSSRSRVSDRVDAVGEFVRAAQFAVQFVGLGAGVLEVVDQALPRGSCGCWSGRRRRTRRRSGSRSPAPGRRRSARLRGSARCSPSAGEG